MLCARKGCSEEGLVSLSELCNIVYRGQDSKLAFCEEHVLDMLARYRRFKLLEEECGLIPIIRNPMMIFFLRYSDMQFHCMRRTLCQTLELRAEFQCRIVCATSSGHDHWMANIKQACEFCDAQLWHTVFRSNRKYKHKRRRPSSW